MPRLARRRSIARRCCSPVATCSASSRPTASRRARDADGKAIGAACRHAGRAIEDCFTLYRKADRAAVFAGWRDMNDYMRENKIEPVPPQFAIQPAPLKPAALAEPAEGAAPLQTAARAKDAKAPDS